MVGLLNLLNCQQSIPSKLATTDSRIVNRILLPSFNYKTMKNFALLLICITTSIEESKSPILDSKRIRAQTIIKLFPVITEVFNIR